MLFPEEIGKIFFIFFLFLLLTTLSYIVLNEFGILKEQKRLNLIISLSSSFLIIIFIISSPIGKYLTEVVLPFVLLSIFFLIMVKVFFSPIGIKFGEKEDENSFISTTSSIIMWTGAALLLISLLAALKEMGYKVINKLLEPSIYAIILFFLMVYFVVLSFESEKEK